MNNLDVLMEELDACISLDISQESFVNSYNNTEKLASNIILKNIEKIISSKFPEDLKKFIYENNGSIPFPPSFKVGPNQYGQIKYFLSFNVRPYNNFPVDQITLAIHKKYRIKENIIPFAITTLNNYICYDVKFKNILLLDVKHHVLRHVSTSLNKFLLSLTLTSKQQKAILAKKRIQQVPMGNKSNSKPLF